jgi:CheY-like chemotaxis protein
MPIIVLTNHDSAEHEKAALQKGADHFLSKEHSGGLRLLDVIQKSIRRQDIN